MSSRPILPLPTEDAHQDYLNLIEYQSATRKWFNRKVVPALIVLCGALFLVGLLVGLFH
jgi:hypothetical protein